MPHAVDLTLIFPAYNEAKRIAFTLAEAKAYLTDKQISHEIIVAADGNDGTREIVYKMAESDSTIKVIGSIERKGKGYGIRQAVALAHGVIIGFSDADNKTPITEYDKVKALLGSFDLVIGSRGLAESKIEKAQPFHRRLGSKGFGIYMRTMTGLNDIVDTQCGFKFFQRAVALDLFSRQRIDGYMYDVEILCLARRLGYSVGQVPVRWRDDGDSRLNLVRGNIRNFLDILSIWFWSHEYRVWKESPKNIH